MITIDNKSSISDYQAYKDVCRLAAIDDQAFNTFKSNTEYNVILEHTTSEQGQAYINYIELKKTLDLDSNVIELFAENDEQGGAHVVNYGDKWGDISPSTLRYVKVLSELVEHFGTLDNFKIAEIGVGYGGQCMTITNYFDVQNYTLIDLPEVLALAKRYLSINDSSNLEFKTMSELKVSEYDLIISNYAITECNKRVQLEYINKVLRGSKHGYITCNYISDYFNIDSLTKDEFIEALGPDKQVKIVDEQPLTHARNFILIW